MEKSMKSLRKVNDLKNWMYIGYMGMTLLSTILEILIAKKARRG